MEEAKGFGVVPKSSHAERTFNPIRAIVEKLNIPKETEGKKLIPLSIGDPTVFGNLKTPQVFIEAVQTAAAELGNHGYKASVGMLAAREAIAKRHSKMCGGKPISPDDVILASGCSGALEIAIKALCSEGDNILIPRPGFALYETLAKSYDACVKYYPLLPEKQWEADLDELEKQIDNKTKGILINNPSNPCGSVYSKSHLESLLKVAEKHGLPIIADEIYGNIVFEGEVFYPLASLTTTVPILEVGGIAKEFLVPGFRIGWLIMHDAPISGEPGKSVLCEVKEGVRVLTQLLVGPNTIVQAALPAILDPKDEDSAKKLEAFHSETLSELESNAQFLMSRFEKMKGINPVRPQGAMYVMIGIEFAGSDVITDDVVFADKLVQEEFVFLLPGACFGMKNFCRVVFCAPKEILADACDRIERFCSKYFANE